jgi:hypothetical protein
VSKDLIGQKDYIEQCLADSEQVQMEDIDLCERVQVISSFTSFNLILLNYFNFKRGLTSTVYELGGRYAPSLEGGEFMFHKLLREDLRQAIASMNSKI